MEPMSKDWEERLNKAQTNKEFMGLLEEIPMSANISLTDKDALESYFTEQQQTPSTPTA